MTAERRAERIQVEDVMTTNVVAIGPDETVTSAARRMCQAGVSGLPVVDGSGAVIGIVTEADLLRALGRRDPAVIVRDPAQRRPAGCGPVTVQDAMSRGVIGIGRDASIAEAARLLCDSRVKRLPVLGPDRELEGIVSRADIVAVLGRPDLEIEAEIRAGMVGDPPVRDPATIGVTVEEGMVTLTGGTHRKTEAAALTEFAANVLGVSQVRDDLFWSWDDSYPRRRPRFHLFHRAGT